MFGKVAYKQVSKIATTIPKNYFSFLIDFNIIYDILNFIKANMKGELNWRLIKYLNGYFH